MLYLHAILFLTDECRVHVERCIIATSTATEVADGYRRDRPVRVVQLATYANGTDWAIFAEHMLPGGLLESFGWTIPFLATELENTLSGMAGRHANNVLAARLADPSLLMNIVCDNEPLNVAALDEVTALLERP